MCDIQRIVVLNPQLNIYKPSLKQCYYFGLKCKFLYGIKEKKGRDHATQHNERYSPTISEFEF